MTKPLKEITPVEAVAYAATMALREFIEVGMITQQQGDVIVNRMNELVALIFTGKVVTFDEATGKHIARERKPEDDEPTDVLVIKGASA